MPVNDDQIQSYIEKLLKIRLQKQREVEEIRELTSSLESIKKVEVVREEGDKTIRERVLPKDRITTETIKPARRQEIWDVCLPKVKMILGEK